MFWCLWFHYNYLLFTINSVFLILCRYLSLVHNKLTVLPASLYRKQLFINLLMSKNYLGINTTCFDILKALAPYKFELLRPEYFETVAVPSLFDIATRFIIDNGYVDSKKSNFFLFFVFIYKVSYSNNKNKGKHSK